MSSSGGFRHGFPFVSWAHNESYAVWDEKRPIIQVPRSPRGTLALIEAIRKIATNHRI